MVAPPTLDADFADGAVAALVAPAHHQLVVAELRHGEVHEVPPGDVHLAVDVARFPEHDLGGRGRGKTWGRGRGCQLELLVFFARFTFCFDFCSKRGVFSF